MFFSQLLFVLKLVFKSILTVGKNELVFGKKMWKMEILSSFLFFFLLLMLLLFHYFIGPTRFIYLFVGIWKYLAVMPKQQKKKNEITTFREVIFFSCLSQEYSVKLGFRTPTHTHAQNLDLHKCTNQKK